MYTDEEEKKFYEIQRLKAYLNGTDYIWNSIKEGDATEEDYAEIIEKRHQARMRIRELEV